MGGLSPKNRRLGSRRNDACGASRSREPKRRGWRPKSALVRSCSAKQNGANAASWALQPGRSSFVQSPGAGSSAVSLSDSSDAPCLLHRVREREEAKQALHEVGRSCAYGACPCDAVHLPQPNVCELVLKALVRSALVESQADAKAGIVSDMQKCRTAKAVVGFAWARRKTTQSKLSTRPAPSARRPKPQVPLDLPWWSALNTHGQALALAMMAKAPIEAVDKDTASRNRQHEPTRCKPTRGKRSKSTCPRD